MVAAELVGKVGRIQLQSPNEYGLVLAVQVLASKPGLKQRCTACAVSTDVLGVVSEAGAGE
jgi:hypothetical protein